MSKKGGGVNHMEVPYQHMRCSPNQILYRFIDCLNKSTLKLFRYPFNVDRNKINANLDRFTIIYQIPVLQFCYVFEYFSKDFAQSNNPFWLHNAF